MSTYNNYGGITVLENERGFKRAYATTAETAEWMCDIFKDQCRLEVVHRYPTLNYITPDEESLIKLAWEAHEIT